MLGVADDIGHVLMGSALHCKMKFVLAVFFLNNF